MRVTHGVSFVSSKILYHYNDVIMGVIASQITSLVIVYSTIYSDTDQRKHQSSASLAFVWGIHQGPVNSPHQWPVTQKMFPFDDVIMIWSAFLIEALNMISYHDWGFCLQKQVSQAGISNCIPQNTVGCNYLSLPKIPVSGDKVLN